MRTIEDRKINPWTFHITHQIKPMSVNLAHTMRKNKSKVYRNYQKEWEPILDPYKITDIDTKDMMLKASFIFGFSSPLSDVDNPIKPLLDILQNSLGFNDRIVFEVCAKKVIVSKGEEYVDINLEEIFK